MTFTSSNCRLKLSLLFCTLSGIFLTGCVVNTTPNDWRALSTTTDRVPMNLFVFFDGTANNASDEKSWTNVYRLYTLIEKDGNPATRALYIEGVGNARNPLTGMLFGVGMEKRIQEGYEFLSKNYKADDRIYIFGFSRGAHQARALAGLIAYSGLPSMVGMEDDHFRKIGNRIIERTKEESDTDLANIEKWRIWEPGGVPPLAQAIKDDKKKLGYDMVAAEVRFLGLWDTVPGSAWKDFGTCMEAEDGHPGDRYKSGSYPPIRRIAHAVAMDEKRDRFRPILLCRPAINPNYTRLDEVRFPGSHSDVGGGYRNSPASCAQGSLANLSLNWMVALLAEEYRFISPPPHAADEKQDAAGPAHWPVGEGLARFIYDCEDRDQTSNAGAEGFARQFAQLPKHWSIAERQRSTSASVVLRNEEFTPQYPVNCAEAPTKLRTQTSDCAKQGNPQDQMQHP